MIFDRIDHAHRYRSLSESFRKAFDYLASLDLSALTDGRLRKSNVAGVYSVPRPHEVAGKKILVIDDILTTGATLEEAAQTLRAAGAAQVVAAAFCRTPKT